MVKKFIDFVNEGLWDGIIDRGTTGNVRKEDGRRVHTCIGIDIILKDPNLEWQNLKYDDIIKELVENDSSDDILRISINHSKVFRFFPEEMANVRNFKAPYDYLIYDGRYGTDLVVSFPSYEYIRTDEDEHFPECVCEEDYISICRGIAIKMKEIGDSIEYIPINKGRILGSNDCGDGYVIRLIKENAVWNWVCKQDEEDLGNYEKDFWKDMTNEFVELQNEDVIVWNYDGYANSMAINISVENLKNAKKYIEYTKNWFKV